MSLEYIETKAVNAVPRCIPQIKCKQCGTPFHNDSYKGKPKEKCSKCLNQNKQSLKKNVVELQYGFNGQGIPCLICDHISREHNRAKKINGKWNGPCQAAHCKCDEYIKSK